MDTTLVAKIWWEAPHDGLLERMMFAEQVVTFGRSKDAHIRIGHAVQFDPTVPRQWGAFTWHRNRVMIENLDERWGFDLVCVEDDPRARITVAPGCSASPSSSRFEVHADAPRAAHRLHVTTTDRHSQTAIGGAATAFADPPSFVPFSFTPTQRLIGATLVRAQSTGRARRVSYDELAADTHYSRRRVREVVYEMDALLLVNGLSRAEEHTDALDRVWSALVRHQGLIK